MNRLLKGTVVVFCISVASGFAAGPAMPPMMMHPVPKPFLPDASDSKIVSVTPVDSWTQGGITISTMEVPEEPGKPGTPNVFGEVFSFTPNFVAMRKDKPTILRFWNLQSDDPHNFTLLDPEGHILMDVTLPEKTEVVYQFTFHQEGLYSFQCSVHPPAMSGQILVIP